MAFLPIDRITVGQRFRKDMGSLSDLMHSIQALGLLHPVVVREDGQLIAGQRRLEACRQLGMTEIPVTVVDLQDIVRAEHDENAIRKAFLPSEMVAIAEAMRPAEEDAARKRQRKGISLNADEPSGKLPEGSSVNTDEPSGIGQLSGSGQSRDHVARYVGISASSLGKARAVVDAAKDNPDRYTHLVEDMDEKQSIDNAYRKLRDMQAREALADSPPPMPTGTYGLILADPPWAYEHMTSPSRDLANQYATMTLEQLADWPELLAVMDDDVLLYLWTTSPKLKEAMWLIEQWGFDYRTNLVWIKDKIGMGYYARQQHELVLIAKRGNPSPPFETYRESSVIHSPRLAHSQKPNLHELLDRQYPGLFKLELFARQSHPELTLWTFWGNEVG